MGFFVKNENGQARNQNAIWRTSCLDCQDRTNFVQSRLSTLILHRVLSDIAIGCQSDKVSTVNKENPFQLNNEELALI